MRDSQICFVSIQGCTLPSFVTGNLSVPPTFSLTSSSGDAILKLSVTDILFFLGGKGGGWVGPDVVDNNVGDVERVSTCCGTFLYFVGGTMVQLTTCCFLFNVLVKVMKVFTAIRAGTPNIELI